MNRSFVISLLCSSFFVSSLEAMPPKSYGKEEKAPYSSKSVRPKVDIINDTPSGPTNPFKSSHMFGLNALKKWDRLSPQEKTEWQQDAESKVKTALTQKINNNIEDAKATFLTNVRERGCPTSMYWLGRIAEGEHNFEKAFSWYIGSFFTRILQGKSFKEITDQPSNLWTALNNLSSKLSPQVQSVVPIITPPPSYQMQQYESAFFGARTIGALLANVHKYYCSDEDLSAYTVELTTWSSVNSSRWLEILGMHFQENKLMDKAGYCFYLSKSKPSQCYLADLIVEQHVNYDQEGKLFQEKDRYDVAAELYRQSRIPNALNNLAFLIAEGKTTKGLNGEDISEENEKEILIHLFELSANPHALVNHALLLLITEGEKKDVKEKACDLFLKAMLAGDSRARQYYTILSHSMEEETASLLENLGMGDRNSILSGSESDEEISVPPSGSVRDPLSCRDQAEFVISDQIQLYLNQEGNEVKESSAASLAILSSNPIAIQSSAEPAPIEAQEGQISSEERKKLKNSKKTLKKETSKKRKRLFRKLLKGNNLSSKEQSFLMKKGKVITSANDLKVEIEVKLDKKALSQFRSLPDWHKAKVWSRIDSIKAGDKDGQPEKLRAKLNGENLFSQRINKEHRLVYTLSKNVLTIRSCEGHYDD